ncbi:MAG: nuclear transport factor 2 family protein [Candidatus Thorarchaeota archaeon]|nr:nuclear transport factor 2 family protein [Candidatus Thorarchaeota archaeon]
MEFLLHFLAMTAEKRLAYLIYLRNALLLISKVNYSNWQEIQDDFEHYMTSLGPWTTDEIIAFFEGEYGEESSWMFTKNQIRKFIASEVHILPPSGMNLGELKSKSATALWFNEHIDKRNLEGLSSLMTENHTFIDSSNDAFVGKERMTQGWQDFFTKYPDYRNIFERVEIRNDIVVMIGYSTCSYAPLDGPALWSAKIRDDKVVEWRVFHDTKENRNRLGVE